MGLREFCVSPNGYELIPFFIWGGHKSGHSFLAHSRLAQISPIVQGGPGQPPFPARAGGVLKKFRKECKRREPQPGGGLSLRLE